LTDTTARNYNFAGCTVAAQPALSTTTNRTVYSILYLAASSTCFVSWISGY
ncbi:MAG: hypothetical protein JST16_18835, partial [Bdellovibrionales bacterium]|nr:hypothetical protein [Bdellovibrionales bacterium]